MKRSLLWSGLGPFVSVWILFSWFSCKGVQTGGLSASSISTNTSRFSFREPAHGRYLYETAPALRLLSTPGPEWLRARQDNGSQRVVEFGRRIILRLAPGTAVEPLLAGRPLELARRVTDDLFILQAPDAWTAASQAQSLAAQPGVLTSHPVRRKQVALHGRFAPRPNDPRYTNQWHLENRAPDGSFKGTDLNVRAAWPFARGGGVIVAIGDDGLDFAHPDFIPNLATGSHRNFHDLTDEGSHPSSLQHHGTSVGGLVGAAGDNGVGVSGVAPQARLASWVIFNRNDALADEEHMMDMFQYQSNIVSVQNHSWGNSDPEFLAISDLEIAGISNAVNFGRGGRGVILVQAAGNERVQGADVNFDGYAHNPYVIAVGAVRFDGRPTRYSDQGACVLVAAPSGESTESGRSLDLSWPTIYTTDRLGVEGRNSLVTPQGDADYAFGATGFIGTSAATPMIAGVAALMLSARPELGWRDVQQIFAYASHQTFAGDGSTQTNGAGLRVNHNTGYGVPDAGQAVELARAWRLRPAPTNISYTFSNFVALPDDGLRVAIEGRTPHADLLSIPAFPGLGVQSEGGTPDMPIIHVGVATNEITQDLTGKAALIQHDASPASEKVARVAAAGAAFAVIYNNAGGTTRLLAAPEYVPIPAVFISQNHGELLRDHLAADPTATARLERMGASYSFTFTNTLLCESVSVKIAGEHSSFGELRMALVSPSSTVSVLQRMRTINPITFAGWTYHSKQHFNETSAGTWKVHVTDEYPGRTGSVNAVTLTISGVPITDTDRDALDDDWERTHFGDLAQNALGDFDADGANNSREMILGTDPRRADIPFTLDLSAFDPFMARLSWPGQTNRVYEIYSGSDPASPTVLNATIPGRFPETEWFTPTTNLNHQFYRILSRP